MTLEQEVYERSDCPPDLILLVLPSFKYGFVYALLSLFFKRFVTESQERSEPNRLLIGINAYLFVMGILVDPEYIFSLKSNWWLKQAALLYMILKYVELSDTAVMLARGAKRQISGLHVFHHGSMIVFAEFVYKVQPFPSIGLVLLMNSVVHVFMYGYYAYSALKPGVPVYWKKAITQMQIIQFLIGLVHCTYGWLYCKFCPHGIFYALAMLAMFGNFYYNAYIRKRSSKKTN